MPISTTTLSSPLTINGLLKSRSATHPNFKILSVPNRDLVFESYTYSDIHTAGTLLANYYASEEGGGIPMRAIGDRESKMVVGLLAPSGFDYVINEVALSRMGFCVLFISINNSPAAIAHLLSTVQASVLVVHPTYQSIARDALPFLKDGDGFEVKLTPIASVEVYSAEARARAVKMGLEWEWRVTEAEEQDLPAFIVHSSGSTGFPKPIIISHRKAINNFSANFNLTGFTTLPLYHNHGISCLWRGFYSVKPIFLFPASDLPLTTGNVLALLSQPICDDLEALFGVPFVYKLLLEDDKGVEILKKYKLCLYGGSPMPDELGDRLVAEGVRLAGHIGSTEMGQLMTSFRDFNNDKEWNWFRSTGPYAVKNIDKFSDFESRGGEGENERFELIVKNGWPTKTLSNRTNGDYATSDAFLKHPTIPGAWKFNGRLDDTLVMLTGEKTNPVPMEGTLRGSSPHIFDAIVFGQGRSQTGALIILSESTTALNLPKAALLSLVAPAIAAANHPAPSHSQLSPETLVFLPFTTFIPRADKGSFLRPKCYKLFESVIEGVYKRLEGEGDEEGVVRKEVGSMEEMEEFVMKVVKEVEGGRGLDKETDLFDRGLDSLQATRIRNALQRGLNLKGARLTTNFVFDRPTVSKMSAFLVALASGGVSKLKEPTHTEIMLQLVDKYKHLDVSIGQQRNGGPPSLTVVVLTGATGSLGAYLLAELLASPSVTKVYCLARGRSDEEATKRVFESMATRGLTLEKDDTRVVSLASDLGEENLGLEKEVYDAIASEVTMVVHNAWLVNFNVQISSFEPHIRGAHNLMQLCLKPSTPANFYFSSSVSSVFAWPGPGLVPEAITEKPEYAQNMGYARSKWVVEKLCEVISETTPLQAGVLRIGQMVGDSKKGIWNETEAISLIFKSANTIHALPLLADKPAWLPVDYAAKTIIEVIALPSSASPTATPVWHILQPQVVSWNGVLDSFKTAGLEFEAVNQRKWVQLLRESDDDAVTNPTKKLLEFFEGKFDVDDKTFAKRYPLETTRTVAASSSLQQSPISDDALVAKWYNHWKSTGFLV